MAYRAKKYSLTAEQIKKIMDDIADFLADKLEVDFAFIHGSFVNAESFGDIDVAVYLFGNLPVKPVSYEIALEVNLETLVKYPVDVRLLNGAPLSFQYQVIKNGAVLFERDGDRRADFQSRTFDMYFDFFPYRKRYLKEVLGLEV